MNVTVIVCTFNRCNTLADALNSLAASVLPQSTEWEVLVVDNNSDDQTASVVEQFRRRNPRRFRYLYESQSGKSFALNSGIRASRGEVLAFVDDDVTVEPTWLQNLTMNLFDGRWAGAGGRTLPAGTFTLPPWLTFEGPYGLGGAVCSYFNAGDTSGDLDRPPYGANMAFRREMFEKYGPFRVDLGPSPDKDIPRSGEDTEFGHRLMAAGERIRYEPTAIVRHPVRKERLNKKYISNLSFDAGRYDAREMGPKPDIFGIPRRYLTMLKLLVVIAPKMIFRWLFALQSHKRFYSKCLVWRTFGQVVEFHKTNF